MQTFVVNGSWDLRVETKYCICYIKYITKFQVIQMSLPVDLCKPTALLLSKNFRRKILNRLNCKLGVTQTNLKFSSTFLCFKGINLYITAMPFKTLDIEVPDMTKIKIRINKQTAVESTGHGHQSLLSMRCV